MYYRLVCLGVACLSMGSLCAVSSVLVYEKENRDSDFWTFLVDYLYMKRENLKRQTIVNNFDKPQDDRCGCNNFHVLNARKVQNKMDFEPGVRGAVSFHGISKMSLEFSGFTIKEWKGRRAEVGERSLYFPFHLLTYTEDYVNASRAIATYRSKLWGLECNFWKHVTRRHDDYFSFSWLAGLRYFDLSEHFKLEFQKPPHASAYNISTQNRMYGGQVGVNLQLNPTHWYFWDVTTKLGGLFNRVEQKTDLRDRDNTVVLRYFTHRHWVGSFFTDITASFQVHYKEFLNAHVGYEFLFFSNTALAPDQISKGTQPTSGHSINSVGHPIIHGLFAGIVLGF